MDSSQNCMAMADLPLYPIDGALSTAGTDEVRIFKNIGTKTITGTNQVNCEVMGCDKIQRKNVVHDT